MSNKMSYIEVNDIFDELIEENKRLKKYLKVSLKFKSFVHLIIDKLKNNLDSNDLQEFQRLSKELEDIFSPQMVTNWNYETKEFNNKINTSSESSKTSRNSDNKDVDKNQIQSPDEDICTKKSLNKKKSIICDFIGCGKYFISNEKLKKHSLIHTNINSKRNRFVCNYKDCDYKTDRPYEFKDHIKKHENIRDFVCNYCDKRFHTKYILNKHIKEVHINSSQSFRCDYNNCNKVFKFIKSLDNHKKLCHSNEKTISCDYPNCGFKCILNSRLIVHKRKHSNDRPFKCSYDDCAFTTKYKQHLLAHLRSHSTPLKCLHEGCGKTFKSASALSKHSLIHLGITINCEWPGCEYQTYNELLLKSHIISHSGEQKFICDWPQCGKRFKTKSSLETHYRIHTNDKRFVCYWPGCQYRCVSSANLGKHIRGVHKKIKIGGRTQFQQKIPVI